MGLMTDFFAMLFGSNRNVLAETAEVFRINAENASAREAAAQSAALHQFAAEFRHVRRGWFDRSIDGLNRLPRPLMAFGTLSLVAAAMVAPEWFSARMTGLALVPEPLWWLMGAIVSFYFGARHQAKGQQFQQALASTMVAGSSRTARRTSEPATESNPALDAWRAENGA
ncbi:MAG: holin family protein [Pseudomonadota bacterium]